jgi:hypothetical protein
LFNKPLIFVVISVLVIALFYSSSSSFNVYALPMDQGYAGSGTCGAATTDPRDGKEKKTCCWSETEFGQGHIRLRVNVNYCQTCTTVAPDCGPKQRQGALEQTPASPPSGAPVTATPLQDGGILQQTPPPLFGRNTAAPLGGGVLGQPTTVTTPTLTPPPPTGGEDTQSRTIGTSPTGGCVTYNRVQCIPCDLGLAGAACTPASEWPPVLSTDEGIPQAQLPSEEEEGEEEQPPGTLSRPTIGGIPPEAQIAPEGDEGTQPQTQEDAVVEE